MQKAHPIVHDRLEEIKRIWGAGNSDIHWLINEVERLRVELEGQCGAYLMAINDVTARRQQIATLREALVKTRWHAFASGKEIIDEALTTMEEKETP